jgi:hypothetical protein
MAKGSNKLQAKPPKSDDGEEEEEEVVEEVVDGSVKVSSDFFLSQFAINLGFAQNHTTTPSSLERSNK